MKDFVLNYFFEVNVVVIGTKNLSMINQMLIFIYGACYPLMTPKVLKHENTLDKFNGGRCLKKLEKVAFLKNYSEK